VNEAQLKALRELSQDNSLSQRELSKRIGISLGSVNYIIKALLKEGYIKAQRFKNSNNKMAYVYVLTPQGMEARIKQTQIFLKRTYDEYLALCEEMELMKKESAGPEGHGGDEGHV
jgi:EPS-associated MarR family transcriptional regulator